MKDDEQKEWRQRYLVFLFSRTNSNFPLQWVYY